VLKKIEREEKKERVVRRLEEMVLAEESGLLVLRGKDLILPPSHLSR